MRSENISKNEPLQWYFSRILQETLQKGNSFKTTF